MYCCSQCNTIREKKGRRCPHCKRRAAWYKPSLEQIREACSEIQSGWTAADEQSRRAGAYRRVEALVLEVTYARR